MMQDTTTQDKAKQTELNTEDQNGQDKPRRIQWQASDLVRAERELSNCSLRWVLIAFGWTMVGLGLIGVVVPGLPTTVFMLIALWAFSKSSKRFHIWLWTHPKFGPSIRAWHEHKVIPKRAKILAVVMMTASFIYVGYFVAESWALPALLAAIMVPAAAYILSRASEIPVIAPVSSVPVRIEPSVNRADDRAASQGPEPHHRR